MRGPTSYGIGVQSSFGGSSDESKGDSSNPLDAIREQTSKIEDMLDTLSEPIKPYALKPTMTLMDLCLLKC
jgi:hypothetical protein